MLSPPPLPPHHFYYFFFSGLYFFTIIVYLRYTREKYDTKRFLKIQSRFQHGDKFHKNRIGIDASKKTKQET